MNQLERLRNQAENQRIEIIELRNDLRMAGFGRVYGAVAVAGLVLMWFPVYKPVVVSSDSGTTEIVIGPLISAVRQGGLIGLVTLVALGGLIGLTIAGAFRTRLKSPALPIAILAITALGILMLLIRFGGGGRAEYTATGTALLTLLFLLLATAVAQLYAYLNQPVPMSTEPLEPNRNVPPS